MTCLVWRRMNTSAVAGHVHVIDADVDAVINTIMRLADAQDGAPIQTNGCQRPVDIDGHIYPSALWDR